MEMHKDFGIWSRSIDQSEDLSRLERRWQGVVSLIDDMNTNLAEYFVGLHFDIATLNDSAKATLISKWKEVNPFLDANSATEELKFAASAALAVLLDNEDDESSKLQIALAVISASCSRKRSGFHSINLIDRAETYVGNRSIKDRIRATTATANEAGWIKVSSSATESHEDDESISKSEFEKSLNALSTKINNGMRRMETALRNDLKILQDQLDMKDEELDILWWAYNGYSDTRQLPLGQVIGKERALLAACELASYTRRKSPPRAASELLLASGISEEDPEPFNKFIDASDPEWIQQQEFSEAGMLTPVSLALQNKLAMGKNDQKNPDWAGSVGLAASDTFSEAEIAKQFYNELLFLRMRT